METGRETFLQEVRDNFLMCRLCGGEFDRPKTLPCLHTFCQQCLIKFADENRHTYRYSTYCKPITCPVCRRRTDITKNDVESLPDNFLITSLSGIINEKTKNPDVCQICSRKSKAGRFMAATHRCLDCDKQMCKRCVIQHSQTKVTMRHSLYSLESADRLMCTEHDDEAIRFICRSCSRCVCVFCTYTTHKEHDLISITEGSATYQQELEETVESCKQKMQTINHRLEFIGAWEKCYKETREHILDTATNFLTQIESQRQAFLGKLDSLHGPEVLQLLEKKGELMQNLEGLSSACKYEKTTDPHSLETLLIHNELTSKVKHLLDTPLPSADVLLDNHDINISFHKGGVSLGSLVKQEGSEEPIYYDETNENEDSVWCRRCRDKSRSQSVSKGVDIQTDLGKFYNSKINKYISDTDLSLTDVSALDMTSNHGEQINALTSASSTSSELDKITTPNHTNSSTQYEQPIRINCSTETQYEPMIEFVSTESQYDQPVIELVTCEAETQYDTRMTPEKRTRNAETQYDIDELIIEQFTQQSANQPLLQQTPEMNLTSWAVFETEKETTDSGSMTEFYDAWSERAESQENYTQMEPVTKADMASDPVNFGSQSRTTQCSAQMTDSTCDPIKPGLSTKSTQSSIESQESSCDPIVFVTLAEISTGTDPVPQLCDAFSQTVQKSKDKSVTAQASMKDSSTSNEISSSEKGCQYNLPKEFSAKTIETQTQFKTFERFTNTDAVLTQEKGVGVVTIVSNQSTMTIAQAKNSKDLATQATVESLDKCIGNQMLGTPQETQCDMKPEVNDSAINTELIPGIEIACGNDLPIDNTKSIAIETDPIAKRSVALTVRPATVSLGTSPKPRSVTNRACGTERPGIRHVALTVKPRLANQCTETNSVELRDKAIGDQSCVYEDSATMALPQMEDIGQDTSDLINLKDSCSNTPGCLHLVTRVAQTNTILYSDNYTQMLEPGRVEKYTNTPNQLPEERLLTFKRTQSVENVHRATQTEFADSWRPDADSMLPTNASTEHAASLAATTQPPASALPQPQLSTTTTSIQSYNNPAQHRTELLKTKALNPPLISQDSITNPQDQQITSQDNIIPSHSQPIVSQDYLKHPHNQPINPQYFMKRPANQPIMVDQSTSTQSLTQLLFGGERSGDQMDNKISECITKLRQVTRKLQYSSSSDMSTSRPLTSTSSDATGSLVSTPRSLDPLTQGLTAHDQIITKENTTPYQTVMQENVALYSSVGTAVSDSSVYQLSTSEEQTTSKQDENHLRKRVHNYTKKQEGFRKPLDPGISYVKPLKLEPVTAASPDSGSDSTVRRKTHTKKTSRSNSDKLPIQTCGKSSDNPLASNTPTNRKSWDLKTLVQQEDRAKRQQTSNSSSISSSRHLSPYSPLSPSTDDLLSEHSLSASSSNFQSASSSLYGSSESLNLMIAGRGPRRAPKVPVKLGHSRPSSGVSISPAPSYTSLTPPTKTSNHTKRGKTTSKQKARTARIEPSTLLGTARHRSGSSASEKSSKSLSGSESRLKKAPPTSSPRSLVTTVIKKVQSIKKSKSPLSGTTLKQKSTLTKQKPIESTDYPSEVCAERLANHDRDREQGIKSPCLNKSLPSNQPTVTTQSPGDTQQISIKPYLPSASTAMNRNMNSKTSKEKTNRPTNSKFKPIKRPAKN